MLNQAAVEALYSATYVENYLDCVENLPDDLQRQITRMRELDVSYQGTIYTGFQCISNSDSGFFYYFSFLSNFLLIITLS